ncbi:MAG: signal peptidase I [Acutalibacteraceae bacterium]|jgi:signal peptidase I|nr:signal peptidase I [Acutalibacteraceae bacterium]
MYKNLKYIPFICIAFIIVIGLILTTNFKLIIISGQSMAPTYNSGQLVIMQYNKSVERDDVIVFTLDNKDCIKRIVAVPHDSVEQKKGYLYINGIKTYYTSEVDEKIIELAEDEFYVVGDNFENSNDSRYFGVVKYNQILGKII